MKIPEDLIRLQRFCRDLHINRQNAISEGDKDSLKIVNDETWQQIRDNFDIVVNGVVALAKIVENAQRVEQELLSYIEKLKNSRDDLTHNHIGNAMRGERTFISRELTKIVNKFQEEA